VYFEIQFYFVLVVSAFNNWSQERQFQKLNKRQKNRTCNVMRDNQLINISIFDLVVGDIFQVQTGELLPCDGLVSESHGIECDESAMTGESLLIKKEPISNPFMLCGCKVMLLFIISYYLFRFKLGLG
jgi:Ca2+-transporting ATPase